MKYNLAMIIMKLKKGNRTEQKRKKSKKDNRT